MIPSGSGVGLPALALALYDAVAIPREAEYSRWQSQVRRVLPVAFARINGEFRIVGYFIHVPESLDSSSGSGSDYVTYVVLQDV